MRLSAPIHQLKRRAKALSRQNDMPLHAALDQIATGEGFSSWSLLQASHSRLSTAERLYDRLRPGDLVLIGARPGQGKTLISLSLAVEAMKSGLPAFFFTLEYVERDVDARFRQIGEDRAGFGALFSFDISDAINADTIVKALAAAPRGTLAVIDFLQLLDQRRDNPTLMEQVQALKIFAEERGVIMIFISQIDRSYDASLKPFPDLGDVRLPNPLDLTLFNRSFFVSKGEVQFRPAG